MGDGGDGILVCAGRRGPLTNAYVLVRSLRRCGCRLPVEAWHVGPAEVGSARALLGPWGCAFRDAGALGAEAGAPEALAGVALEHTGLRRVLLLDADVVALADPTPLFRAAGGGAGLLLWRAPAARAGHPPARATAKGIAWLDRAAAPDVVAAAVRLARRRRSDAAALLAAAWVGERGEAGGPPFAPWAAEQVGGLDFHLDPTGAPAFQHGKKWDLHGPNRTADTVDGAACLGFVAELRALWDGSGLADDAAPRPVRRDEALRRATAGRRLAGPDGGRRPAPGGVAYGSP